MVKPGTVWALSRRTTRRHYLFSPDAEGKIEQAFWYCLAYAANKYEMLVHAAVLMSTHPHLVVTDVHGNRPLFKQEFHRLFALCVKAIRGWPGEVFDKRSTSEHQPVTPEAIIEAIAYLIANPPSGLAVRFAKEWPGAKTLPRDIGDLVIRVERPDAYFDPDNPQWADVLELELPMVAALEAEYGADEARRRIALRVRELEREALRDSKRRGIPFRGARRVQRTPHTRRAGSYEEFGGLNPQFSAAGDLEAARRAIAERRQFDGDYDDALARWTAGDRSVRFPYGTWWMRVHHGARCRPPP